MARVLVIDNALSHAIYRPAEHWRAATPPEVPVDSVHAVTQALPKSVCPYSHVIVSGSEASIVARAAWAEDEALWLRQIIDNGTPVLGSCWGHQLIAYALGGAKAVGRAPKPELGWLPIDILDGDCPLVGPEGPRLFAFNAHFDEVAVVPAGFVVTARSNGCAVQAMRHADRPIFGLQAHPEVLPDEGAFFLAALLTMFPHHRTQIVEGLAGPRDDSFSVRRIVQRFLQTSGQQVQTR